MTAERSSPGPTRTARPERFTLLGEQDLHLFREGMHYRLYDRLGAHPVEVEGRAGTCFSVWAPDAEQVSVIGDWNEWDRDADPLRPHGDAGIWEGFVPGVARGARYKYHIRSRHRGYRVDKRDPFSFCTEEPPATASVVWDLGYAWSDDEWMRRRKERNRGDAPISIYEVHLGSWRRTPEGGFLSYRDLAHELASYASAMGFTHVELLPVMEHPFYGSWGYQCTAYFAPTRRYGDPQGLMYLVDHLHEQGIGVILDWVPSHFPSDEHALGFFDGSHLYEHADPRQGFHPDWQSLVWNYGRNEVRAFLMSSAFFWVDRYHADGLRVDGVASMLYLDYSRRGGDWIPNVRGGRENLEALDFLRRLNEAVHEEHPDVLTIAEESTAWPMVSRPVRVGGLGFDMKWDMGWMHDTLSYFREDPIHRKYHHDKLTFRGLYAFTEDYVLPLSHDEVVHEKGSLLGRMPGDDWQRFANLRLLLGCLVAQPGKKLLFMGGEFGQSAEWNHDRSLDWHLLEQGPFHRGTMEWVRDLNRALRREPALGELDFEPAGWEWVDCHDAEESVLLFLRRGRAEREAVLVACNFTPVPRPNYRAGVPFDGFWKEILNSDAEAYGGSGQGNLGGVQATPVACHGRPCSVNLLLPPLAIGFFRFEGEA